MKLAVMPALWIALLSADPGALSPGALTIQSQPGVEVVWEGTPLGETNDQGTLLIEGIPAGEYQLELSKPGFGTLQRQITITPDARTTYGGYLEPRMESGARSAVDSAVAPALSAATPPPVEPEPEQKIPEDGVLASSPTDATDSSHTDEPLASEPLPLAGADQPAPPDATAATPTDATASLLADEPMAPEPLPSAGADQLAPPTANAAADVGRPVVGTATPTDEARSPTDGSPRKQALMALGLAVLGGLAIFLTSRRSKSIRTRDLSTAPELRVEKTVSGVTEENRFIESLQERERALRGAAGDEPVVQVEIIDVREIEGEA